jgi:glycosyltransferase involved in cell wall biosynthesis
MGIKRLRHRIALRLAFAAPRVVPDGSPTVYFLLAHAYGLGGTIRTTLNVAGYLAREQRVVVLSTVRLRDEPFFPFPPGVTVRTIDDQRPKRRRLLQRILGVVPGSLVHPDDGLSDRCTLWTDLQLIRRLRRLDPGVLIGTRPSLNLLALAARRPDLRAVGEEHMHLDAHKPAMLGEITRNYSALDAVVVLTEHDLATYQGALPAPARIVRIPNAVPTPPGPPAPLTGRVLLAAGRLTPQKGFDLLIKAFAIVAREEPDVTLRICGGGPQGRKLRRMVKRAGLEDQVQLPGPVKNLDEQLLEASMFVLSSRFEGLPMVLLEAMSRGVPVVSFDCPTGPGEIVEDDRNGLLVPAGDIEALAAAMLALIRDEPRRLRCGAGALETASEYALDSIGPRWTELLAPHAER